jgi:hypothetical protein
MAEHRSKHGERRPAPVPSRTPLIAPEQAAVFARPSPSPGRPPTRRRLSGPRRTGRRFNRWLRTSRGRWTLIALGCAAVILIGLLASGFLSGSSKSPSVKPPQAGASGAATTATASPSPSASKSSSKRRSAPSGLVTDPVATLREQFPDNPLNHLRGPGLHRVVLEVSSSRTIPVLGYLVPTGLGAPYGTVKHQTHWSNQQQAIGPGYLAAIFVQTDSSGAPITCSVTVDGKRTNTETTSGAYGRAVCLG